MSETTPDFEAMTLEELDEWNRQMKLKITALQAEYVKSNQPRRDKVAQLHYDEAVKQMQILADASGRTLQEEVEYWQGRLTFGNGTSPDTGRWRQSNIVLGKDAREGLPTS